MYDVIVVGTRVAGATTAMVLARAGLRVLAVVVLHAGQPAAHRRPARAGQGHARPDAWL